MNSDATGHHLETARSVDADPDVVWRALVDPGARLEWTPGLSAMEPMPAGPLAPDRSWTERRDVFGTEETEVVRVVVADPEARRLVLEVDGEAGTARRGTLRFEWTVAQEEGRARVSVTGQVADLSRKGAILLRFLVGPYTRQVDEELEGLARYLEG